jgi:stage II sporulation protein D
MSSHKRDPRHPVSRRRLLTWVGAASLGLLCRDSSAQDEVSDLQLERASSGRVVRIGTPATGDVATLPLEVYVARVLAAESDPRAADAAREALAIAIRTYALVNEGRHARDGYDLCDNTHCQVVRPANAATRRLTQNTTMQVLTFEGRPAVLYYSASCGGYSERAGEVWPGGNYPYLQSRPDAVHEDEVAWAFDLPIPEADEALKRLGFAGELSGVEVDSRNTSGRAAMLRLIGMEPRVIDGNAFRLAVGSTRLRSTAFSLSTENETLRFVGRGYGHGVGMCVIGAGTRALRGESARAILDHYYPGLVLVRLASAESPARVPERPRPRPFPQP